MLSEMLVYLRPGISTHQWPGQQHKKPTCCQQAHLVNNLNSSKYHNGQVMSVFNGSTKIALPGSYPFADLVDERTQSWPLVASPWHAATMLALYLLLVHYAPKWMASRKALQLRLPLFCYNLLMALLNAHICLELYMAARALNYSAKCQPCRVSYHPQEIRLASAFWWFYITKVLEFTDTAFFILRKKWSQLTFLHVYHHSSMFVICWIVVKWIPTGSTFIPAMLNSFVHIIMYGYYSLSALGPRFYPYLWWKRYLTVLQLMQFVLGLLWGAQAIIMRCEYQPWLSYTGVAYMLTFIFLFGRFYAQKYTSKTLHKMR